VKRDELLFCSSARMLSSLLVLDDAKWWVMGFYRRSSVVEC
jgi:hypothetical protein